MSALRVQIIDALAETLRQNFAVGADATLRGVRVGPWKPDQAAPCASVTDAGMSRVSDWGADDAQAQSPGAIQMLRVSITLDLPAQWDREGGHREWAAFVEGLHVLIAQFGQQTGGAVHSAQVINDEPLEAILEGGSSRQIWALDAEIEFAAEWAA